jgi:hypothetical protein
MFKRSGSLSEIHGMVGLDLAGWSFLMAWRLSSQTSMTASSQTTGKLKDEEAAFHLKMKHERRGGGFVVV